MMPDNTLSSQAIRAPWLVPDSWPTSPVTDFERGGVALGDGTQGINSYNWQAWIDEEFNLKIFRTDLPIEEAITVLTVPDARNIGLSFDRNMNVVLCYSVGPHSYLYWYDSAAGEYTTTLYENVHSPRLTHDDKRVNANPISDVLFFYMKGQMLCYRQQRDRYLIERELVEVPPGYVFERVGMGTNWRIQMRFGPPSY